MIINKDELHHKKTLFVSMISNGKVFIYPTDTIYGMGCDATNEISVKKIRELKGRPKNPFSIIAPSKAWITENCVVDKKSQAWINKLPGPYTLILKLKNKKAIAKSVNNGIDTIGVRIPNHWITSITDYMELPIVSTSANKQGMDFMTSIEDLDHELRSNIDLIVYEGELFGKPSQIIDLTKDDVKIHSR